MANRPVFICKDVFPYYERKDVEFVWFSGFSLAQKQRSIESLHSEFNKLCPGYKVLEVSSKSPDVIGQQLSAFNMEYPLKTGKKVLLECIFQGGKTFAGGGPYTDMYEMHPRDAKGDKRLTTSGPLKEFRLDGDIFPLVPEDFFYCWIYSKALYENKTLLKAVCSMEYDSFTDIVFDPKKAINCQAKALAVFKGLVMAGRIDEAMLSKNKFLDIVYYGK